jgi:hypothetical protein
MRTALAKALRRCGRGCADGPLRDKTPPSHVPKLAPAVAKRVIELTRE